MSLIEAPDDPLTRKMTDKMRDLLVRIVKINGGGVDYFDCDRSALHGLVRRHLVQGKSGNQQRIVHTRRGLELARDIAAICAALAFAAGAPLGAETIRFLFS